MKTLSIAEVSLFGDWMPPGTQQSLARDGQGVWSVTVGPLESGPAIYTFTVDGVTTPDPVNPRIKLRARTSASMVDVPGEPTELWQARDVPHGRVEVNWEKSRVTGDTRAYYVYTPPGYDRSRSTRYPVLYLLHGNNDTAAGWTDAGKANFILDNLLAGKKAVPMIIVMPWGHAIPYGRTNSNNTVVFERYLMEEVIPQVEKKYRTARGRDNRAIVGLSMGGGHAFHIGLSHLDTFSTVAGFSSAVPGDFEKRFQALLDHPETANAKLKLLWFGCGRQDFLFPANQRLAEILTAHNIRHTFPATEGQHNYAIWRRYLGEVAPLLFRKEARAR
ncbi:MAG: esterase [Verrucomicrobia bacterium]|nr:esterase [Verrucomicrobiota bacterium]